MMREPTPDERQCVERRLAGKTICERCGATLESFADQCTADLSERCPGFEAIERALEEGD